MLGTLLLAGIVVVIVSLEAWVFTNFGFGWGSAALVIAVALFAGLMNAITPDKDTDPMRADDII